MVRYRMLLAVRLFGWSAACVGGLFACSTTVRTPATGLEMPEPPDAKEWAVSGYLHSNPTKKIYLHVRGRQIVAIEDRAPARADVVLESDRLIFPGLIDMHSHMKYNVLPLWDLARSQFQNRFEWRERSPQYKTAVSGNMKAVKGDTVCAAVRWAEMKAIAGGVTTMQGIGGDAKCAKDFGTNNIEIPGELSTAKIRAMTDVVMPSVIGSVYLPRIQPYFQRKSGATYDEAYAAMLQMSGVNGFVRDFTAKPHTLANGLFLLVGADFGLPAPVGATTPAALAAHFDATVAPRIQELLTTKDGPRDRLYKPGVATLETVEGAPTWTKLKAAAAAKEVAKMRIWLFGDGKSNSGYLLAPATEAKAFDYLGMGGVKTVASPVRRYIGMFESGVRNSIQNYLKDPKRLAVIAHLAEGRASDDAYNRREWDYLRAFGLAAPGMVLVHGVGMDATQLREAKRIGGISLVWSPFSNLLLYGETLDIEAAAREGLNVALGADWSPTGSKNLLDEMKLARRYLRARGIGIDDGAILRMATENAAIALGLEGRVGCLEAGCQADFFLLDRGTPPAALAPGAAAAPKSAASILLDSDQSAISLVAVKGEPLYGDAALLDAFAGAYREAAPERIAVSGKLEGGECRFEKADRFAALPKGAYDRSLALDLRTYAGIRAELAGKMTIAPDPVYTCQDPKYALRFGSYIEQELPTNILGGARKKLRVLYKLTDDWSPEGSDGSGDDGID